MSIGTRILSRLISAAWTGVFALVFMASCTRVPANFSESKDSLRIYPDYRDVTIPVNIAPMNFHIQEDASDYVTQLTAGDGTVRVITGRDVTIGLSDWQKTLKSSAGRTIKFEVYLNKNKQWFRYAPVVMQVSGDTIDSYVVYRNIQPLYTAYEDMSIQQRNITNFDTETLFSNELFSVDSDPHCVNCHSFQNYNTNGNMQLHIRGSKGGTLLLNNNHLSKVNLKVKGLHSGAVYPSWHPQLNLIAYSINFIGQNFHSRNTDKVEVLDSRSDLILYDADKNTITKITDTKDWMETFPYWSPDGAYLYYVAAYFKPAGDTSETKVEGATIKDYKQIRYDLIRRPFDKKTRTFGAADTMYSASTHGRSATFPRVSPDGKYLLFTMGDYGNFHIWHKSSDLYMMDLRTRQLINTDKINSKNVDSYHSWSSSGRWIVFSSRREDGSYTRLYITHFDKNGRVSKPFVLPQKNPLFNKRFLKSYNIPEFIIKPAATSERALFSKATSKAVDATLE